MTIYEYLGKRHFKGLEEFDLQKSNMLFCIKNESTRCEKSSLKIIISIITELFLKKYACIYHNKTNSTNVLFAFDEIFARRRQDLHNVFENIANCCNNKSFISFTKIGYHIKNIKSLFSSLYVFSFWVWEIIFAKLCYIDKLIVLRLLLLNYNYLNVIGNINLYNYKLIVVFFDASLFSNLLVQRCKKKNIKTATTQHGIMLKFRGKHSLDFAAPEFRCFISDYFLIWNRFTFNQAVTYGIPPQKLIICGISRCIGLKPIEKKQIKKFGVILDGKHTKDNNIRLISIANMISNKFNMNYVIRIHPDDCISDYKDITNMSNHLEISKELRLYDYVKTVDFSLVCNSTCLFEFTFMNHTFFRVKPVNNEMDKYIDSNIPCIHNISDFKKLSEDYTYGKKLFDEFCTISNIEECYTSFFNQFVEC